MIFRGIALASFLAIPALAQSAVDSADLSQSDSSWIINGSVGAEFGYHSVVTQKNESIEIYENGRDSVYPGEKYRNYFQVPGFFGALNVFLHMESPSGQKIDFTLDASSDKWRKFDPKFIQASYEDRFQKLVLGDMFVLGGDLYLAGIDLLGASYDFNLNLKKDAKPLLVLSAFGGENRAPKLQGDRDPDQYNKYIALDEVEAQKMVLGGKLLWNVTNDFDATVGFIGSKDYLEDPFLRDGTT